MERREFLQLLGLFSGTAALSACGSEREQKKLISYLVPPEDGVLPGEARWVAATCSECPAGCGLQVRLREGRPVKVEGMPEHPVSGGGLCMRGQASLWRLYHPERLVSPLLRDEQGTLRPISWDDAYQKIRIALQQSREQGRRSVYLAGRTTGSLADLVESSCAALGVERLAEFELYGHAALRRAYGILFGQPEVPHFRLDQSDFLLTLGADLLETFVSPVDYARQLAARKTEADSRWLHGEAHISLTGVNADERLVLHPGSEPVLLLWLLRRLAATDVARRPLSTSVLAALPVLALADAAQRTGLGEARLEELADGLRRAKAPLVLAGGVATAGEGGLTTAVLAGLLQWLLGAIGQTVDFARAENYAGVGSLAQLEQLADRLQRQEIGVLFIARGNPALHAPAGLGFAERLQNAAFRVGLVDILDETAADFDLLLPLAHALESWGDAEPRRGIWGLLQPVVGAMPECRSEGDVLLALRRSAGEAVAESYRDYLFEQWSQRFPAPELERFAERGWLEQPAAAIEVQLAGDSAAGFLRPLSLPAAVSAPILVIAPSIRRFDGRGRPLALLEEIPDPLTTITYGGWISVSAEDARKLGARDGDELRLRSGEWVLTLPAKLQPGLAAGVFVVQRDYLPSAPPYDTLTGEAGARLAVGVDKAGARQKLPILAGSPSQQGRGLIPDPVHREEKHARVSLYAEHEHAAHRWAMAIDLARCNGCAACVASCYVENNVPVTGRKDHLKGREMSWLRIEPFYDETGRPEFLPMLCQHCHYAPCEPVCPVYAAYHNPEGLNVQVYNRCVGTRYCSHNCPYKVRRFNWWTHRPPGPLAKMRNPDLSVRTRGMMEKCTFCIQRIRAAKDLAKDEARAVRDGEVVTACAQSCPTGAIVFGDLNDADSRIAALTRSARAYRVFEELGTEPSVWYLTKEEGRKKKDEG